MWGFLKRDPDPREITNTDAAAVYGHDDAVFVDVRERDEWAAGHIPGAVHIPLGELARRKNELSRDQQVIALCRSGRRSLDAVDILTAAGFPDVKSMAGGMIEWSRSGRPVE